MLRYLLSQLGQLSFAVKKHAGGERCERCQRQIQRAERVAAVDKIEDQRKPEDFNGHRNRGASRLPPVAGGRRRASGSGRQMARRFVAEARCRAPQQEIYRPAFRGCPADIHRQKKAPTFRSRLSCLRYLFSQPVTRQLSSAYMCLTSVFGMGTGGPT